MLVKGDGARILYGTWHRMLQRCYNKQALNYRYYGARGIKVCDRWRKSWRAFCIDMGVRPDGYTLDRIDNDGDYEPSNCRWATRTEQQNNTRLTRRLTFGGRTQPLSAWAREIGIDPVSLRQRIRLHGEQVALSMERGSRYSVHACRRISKSATGYKGVYAHQCGKYEASCKSQNKKYYLGLFADPVEAAKAYDAKAIELFGEHARLNFPRKGAAA